MEHSTATTPSSSTTSMPMPMPSPMKGRSVQLSTFLKWNMENDFDYEVENNSVVKIWCKCCSRYSEQILSDPRIQWLRGKARTEIESCIVRGRGSTNVSKYSTMRHLESKAHKIGLEYLILYGSLNDPNFQPTSSQLPLRAPTNMDDLPANSSDIRGAVSSACHSTSLATMQFPVSSSSPGTIYSDQVPHHSAQHSFAARGQHADTSMPANLPVVKQEPVDAGHHHNMEHNLGLQQDHFVKNEGLDNVPVTSDPYKKRPLEPDAVCGDAQEAYRKLMKTAYLLAVGGQPLSTFKTMVKVQRANGVKLIQGLGSRNDAREFIRELADTIRERLALTLCSTTAFSVISDCHLASETGDVKQLVQVRILREGIPRYYTVGLQDIERFGDPGDAETMKEAIDEIFEKKVRIPQDCYTKALVSATSDGHSHKPDIHERLLTDIAADGRTWLLPIQCAYHRIKSSLIDVLVKETSFIEVKTFIKTVRSLLKTTDQLPDHYRETAKGLGVHVCSFPVVTGPTSRSNFLNSQRRGVTSLLNNWIALARAIEHCVYNTKQRGATTDQDTELSNILKILQNVDFLLTCCLLKSTLDVLDDLCGKIDRDELFVFEILPNVEEALSRLQDLLDEDTLLLNAGIVLVNSSISQELPKSGSKKVGSKEQVTVTYEQMEVMDVSNSFAKVNSLKEKVLSKLLVCLDKWFSSFQSGIYQHMLWVNPANWRNDPATDLESMQILGRHFASSLEVNGFDESQLKVELKNLRIHVKHYYKGIKAKELWEKIFQYRRTEFMNICLLVEVVLAVGVSNNSVEEGLSYLKTMLTDQRFSSSPQTMDDFMVIKANHATWSETEQEEIIEDALGCYLRKSRRSMTMDESQNLYLLGVSNKRIRLNEESDEELLSDEESDESDGELEIPRLQSLPHVV